MNECSIDLWSRAPALRVITTNPTVRKDGALVMGRGCAKEATAHFPGIEGVLGHFYADHANEPVLVDMGEAMCNIAPTAPPTPALATFPVKDHWKQAAKLEIIEQSAFRLVELVDEHRIPHVLMPRPGCGNGRLTWGDVAPVLEAVLDDRFWVTHVPAKERS